MVADLTQQPAFVLNEYNIQAQAGNATSGSEIRKIPIGGQQLTYLTQISVTMLNLEDHLSLVLVTTRLNTLVSVLVTTPLVSQHVRKFFLTPEEDFYAQSKKQDAGIVFYTGINSQGDLYIGNRRINAITGEETFIDAATLDDDGDEDDVLDGLVTTSIHL
ncbi:MAG: hypothetical protein CM15mV3_2810 [Caudoviricetes sp.]|nr:MAG: hypothetical protein CM15mV3_2810 [Caudoviricetes sp.]